MSKNWIRGALASLALVAAGTASAGVYTQTIVGGPTYLNTSSTPVLLNFDFGAYKDWPLMSATLRVYTNDDLSPIYDPLDILNTSDWVEVSWSLMGTNYTATDEVDLVLGGDLLRVSLDYTKMNLDGTFTAQVRSTRGDFYFLGATLDVVTAPEPATLGLLGLGLFGAGFMARRRKLAA